MITNLCIDSKVINLKLCIHCTGLMDSACVLLFAFVLMVFLANTLYVLTEHYVEKNNKILEQLIFWIDDFHVNFR